MGSCGIQGATLTYSVGILLNMNITPSKYAEHASVTPHQIGACRA